MLQSRIDRNTLIPYTHPSHFFHTNTIFPDGPYTEKDRGCNGPEMFARSGRKRRLDLLHPNRLSHRTQAGYSHDSASRAAAGTGGDTPCNLQTQAESEPSCDYTNISDLIYIPKKSRLKQPNSGPDENELGRRKIDAASRFFQEDYTYLELKPDHATRSVWICNDGRVFMEAFSPLSSQVQDFFTTIAEPICRTNRVHEFKLTSYSLYAAVSVGMQTETILEVMDRFSKVKIPDKIRDFVCDCTASYGKIKLVLKYNKLRYLLCILQRLPD